jgi:hypothetical protein
MSDRLFFFCLAAVALGLIAFASIWPQGLGARSPGPFGSIPLQQTPAMQAAIKREADHARQQMEASTAQVAVPAPSPSPAAPPPPLRPAQAAEPKS